MKIKSLFLFSGIAVAMVFLAGCRSVTQNGQPTPSDVGSSYTAVILGDVHFDGPETNTYHNANAKWSPNKRNEFIRNSGMWKKLMPDLLDAAGKAAQDCDAALAIQLGDIVQGDCPNRREHMRMVTNAFATLKMRFPGIPLLPVMGNHDLRSPDGYPAYVDAMSPLLTKELGRDVKAPDFVVRQGPDIYIFVNFNAPQIDFMKKALEENKDARYIFVVSHGLLVPDSDSTWFLFGRGFEPEVREEMRKLFAKHRVIGISGHVHRTEFIDIAIDGGQITQLVVSSVRANLSRDEINPTDGEKPEDYGLSKYRNGRFPKIMQPYAPCVKSYFSTRAAGFVVLKVADDGVVAEFYPGASDSPAKVFKIR